MWGSVLGVAFLLAIDPLRLGVILLLLSRARPLQNLVAYWIGCLLIGVPSMVVPLMMLHATSMLGSFGQDLATPATAASSNMRHVQIGLGALTLVIAALMSVRRSARQRNPALGRRHRMPAQVGDISAQSRDSGTPTAVSVQLDQTPGSGTATESKSAIRRLLRRARNAWEDGAWWISLVVGIGSGPPAPLCLVVLTSIVASGAAVGTQFVAATVFVFGMYALAEIILVSYLIAPAKTQATMQLLHDRLRPYRPQIVIGVVAAVGLFTLASGFGIL